MVSLPRLVTTARILPFVMLASDSLSAGREIVAGFDPWEDGSGSGLDRAQSSVGMAASFVALGFNPEEVVVEAKDEFVFFGV